MRWVQLWDLWGKVHYLRFSGWALLTTFTEYFGRWTYSITCYEGISDAYYCAECTRLEKDRDGCPKIVNLGASRTDLFYERRKLGKFYIPNSISITHAQDMGYQVSRRVRYVWYISLSTGFRREPTHSYYNIQCHCTMWFLERIYWRVTAAADFRRCYKLGG